MGKAPLIKTNNDGKKLLVTCFRRALGVWHGWTNYEEVSQCLPEGAKVCLSSRAVSFQVHICWLLTSLSRTDGCHNSWAPSHAAHKTPKVKAAVEYLFFG